MVDDIVITLTISKNGTMDISTSRKEVSSREIRGILRAYDENLWLEEISVIFDRKYVEKKIGGLVDVLGEKM